MAEITSLYSFSLQAYINATILHLYSLKPFICILNIDTDKHRAIFSVYK